jgi:hypothetical protein
VTHFDAEEILRRELHAAAEFIEPSPDGLTQIRARLSAPRPVLIAWLMVGWTTVGQPALLRIGEASATCAARLETALGPAGERLHPVLAKVRTWFVPRTEPTGRPSRHGWLRPAAAMAIVIAVAVAGGFGLSRLPSVIQQQANSVPSGQSHGAKGGHHGNGVAGTGRTLPTPASGRASPSPSASASCSPSPEASSSPSPTPSPTPSPSPSVSPSPPVSSASPTPSPTSTDTSGGSGSAPPADGQAADETPPAGGQATQPQATEGQTAEDTSLVHLASPARPSAAAKRHPKPCTTATG